MESNKCFILGDNRTIRRICLLHASLECRTVVVVYFLRFRFSRLGPGMLFPLCIVIALWVPSVNTVLFNSWLSQYLFGLYPSTSYRVANERRVHENLSFIKRLPWLPRADLSPQQVTSWLQAALWPVQVLCLSQLVPKWLGHWLLTKKCSRNQRWNQRVKSPEPRILEVVTSRALVRFSGFVVCLDFKHRYVHLRRIPSGAVSFYGIASREACAIKCICLPLFSLIYRQQYTRTRGIHFALPISPLALVSPRLLLLVACGPPVSLSISVPPAVHPNRLAWKAALSQLTNQYVKIKVTTSHSYWFVFTSVWVLAWGLNWELFEWPLSYTYTVRRMLLTIPRLLRDVLLCLSVI